MESVKTKRTNKIGSGPVEMTAWNKWQPKDDLNWNIFSSPAAGFSNIWDSKHSNQWHSAKMALNFHQTRTFYSTFKNL